MGSSSRPATRVETRAHSRPFLLRGNDFASRIAERCRGDLDPSNWVWRVAVAGAAERVDARGSGADEAARHSDRARDAARAIQADECARRAAHPVPLASARACGW
eukprot:2442031-Pleurochrysis_carterae.AAC.6